MSIKSIITVRTVLVSSRVQKWCRQEMFGEPEVKESMQ
jgi:hypothetical protein